MAQAHLDRLTAVDASFLTQESDVSHMHVGAALTFKGPAPSYEELAAHIGARLDRVPRYRQRLASPPFGTGRPMWVDDQSFQLEYHLRHSGLPEPGGEEELRRLIGRLVSQQLDRSKPLWEMYLVEGLDDDRFALIAKTHHAMVDGISGIDLLTVLFDLEPDAPAPQPPDDEWIPQPPPTGAELMAHGVGVAAGTPIRIARRLLGSLQRPDETADAVREAAQGVGEIAWGLANPAPDVPLNVPIGPHRRFVWVRSSLGDFKQIKDGLGGTINDVVLTVVSGALRSWLEQRSVQTAGMELRAIVPVSVRGKGEHGHLGNRIAALRGPLPVYVADPVQRLHVVRKAMNGLKDSHQALGAEVITGFQDFAPPTLLVQAQRINFSTRLFNLIVTNVPGPQVPLYVLGRELCDFFPIAFLPRDHALAIAIVSYNGGINFGLLGDFDAMEDIGVVAEGIELAIEELKTAAVKLSADRV